MHLIITYLLNYMQEDFCIDNAFSNVGTYRLCSFENLLFNWRLLFKGALYKSTDWSIDLKVFGYYVQLSIEYDSVVGG